jgi:transcriptional regulator with XRE-family HTH domain
MAEIHRLNAIYRRIGDQVFKARMAANLTQQQLGLLVGTSRTSIVLIEKGQQRPPLDRLYQIANALHCDLREWLPPMNEFFTNTDGEISFDESAADLSAEVREALAEIISNEKNGDRP